MKVAVANDHGGYCLRKTVFNYLKENNIDYIDFGTDSDASVDYPDYAKKVAYAVRDGVADAGILICGTGIGIGIAANKVKGIRCAIVHDRFTAEMTKRHNNANIIAFGGRVVDEKTTKEILDGYFNSTFEGGRHQLRVDKITELEK